MVAIQNPILKKQFELYSKLGSDEEKTGFWVAFNQDFESQNEAEQDAMREAWVANVTNIENRMKAIVKQLDKFASEISVLPDNYAGANLLTALAVWIWTK
ncbi:MAG: hypothetical protein K9J37_17600 [Saprospiraceae bacterium]|nr:hypothetical protein [Saprospiraceae bacterium]MCF8251733.1 hypothetical protein [Saprospiraceae bacterium]MCF8281115.1 hypothetical protein [Bacteroidales bacterium]MCF8311787.1 hypothetical protein [Saprospiraceae bacterium]MCF8441763.1 hypothetical protein [Saprospiraceae bacterium]